MVVCVRGRLASLGKMQRDIPRGDQSARLQRNALCAAVGCDGEVVGSMKRQSRVHPPRSAVGAACRVLAARAESPVRNRKHGRSASVLWWAVWTGQRRAFAQVMEWKIIRQGSDGRIRRIG